MAIEKVVIIGSGPAAWTAAIYAARASLEPLVYQGNPFHDENRMNGTLPLGQLNLTTEVENFPTWPFADSEALGAFSKGALSEANYNEVAHHYEGPTAHRGRRAATGPEMMVWCRQQAENFGTRIISDDVVSVDFSKRPFTLHAREGGSVQAKAVIIATGARANYLGLPSEDRFKNNGVSACAVCDGALPRFKNHPLIVVGGGDTAVEEASYLTKYASKVSLVVRRDKLRASQAMVERAAANPKIQILWNRVVDEVLGNDEDGVTGVRLRSTAETKQTEELAVSGMFLGIGHTPNTAFLGDAVKKHPTGYLVWTKPFRTNTSVEGVFAAGDVADDNYRQAVTAAGSGCMAALDAERWLAEHDHE
jgi:thioredoxin reductase (NADPH)